MFVSFTNDFLDETGTEFELQRFLDVSANILCVRGSRFCWPIVFSFGVFQARFWVSTSLGGLVDTRARGHPAFQTQRCFGIDTARHGRGEPYKIRALHSGPLLQAQQDLRINDPCGHRAGV